MSKIINQTNCLLVCPGTAVGPLCWRMEENKNKKKATQDIHIKVKKVPLFTLNENCAQTHTH